MTELRRSGIAGEPAHSNGTERWMLAARLALSGALLGAAVVGLASGPGDEPARLMGALIGAVTSLPFAVAYSRSVVGRGDTHQD